METKEANDKKEKNINMKKEANKMSIN